MSDTKSTCSNQVNKTDLPISNGSLTRSTSQRKMSVVSKVSQSSQDSGDNIPLPENAMSSKRFALWAKRVTKMVDVRRKLSTYKSQPSTVKENYNEGNYSPKDDFIKKVNESDFPICPRFPATMSIEAQYAYLKGYENLITSQLKSSVLPNIERGGLVSGIPLKAGNDQFLHLEPKIKMKNDHISFIQYIPQGKIDNITLPTRLQQFSTTYRLQNAIDILDSINSRNGKCTFANHHQRHNIEPLAHFSIWKNIWEKDFEFRTKLDLPCKP